MKLRAKEVWIIEGNKASLEDLRKLLNDTGYFRVTSCYRSAAGMLRDLRKNSSLPDFVVSDVLPETGVDLARVLYQKYKFCGLIFYTTVFCPETFIGALKAGAGGYLIKGEDLLIDALSESENGGYPINNRLKTFLIEQFRLSPDSPLTRREAEILDRFSSGLSLKQVSEHLFISIQTTKTHIRNIYLKLGVNNKHQAIFIARAKKYI